jgi:hypothetical protein
LRISGKTLDFYLALFFIPEYSVSGYIYRQAKNKKKSALVQQKERKRRRSSCA